MRIFGTKSIGLQKKVIWIKTIT